METQDQKNEFRVPSRGGHIRGGLVLLAIGAVLFARQLGFPFPYWFFTWPMILIALGLFIGFKHGFRNPGWIMMIALGGIFLADDIIPNLDLRHYTLPIIFVAIGIMMIFRPKDWGKWNDPEWRERKLNRRRNRHNRWNYEQSYNNPQQPYNSGTSGFTVIPDASAATEDYINSVAVFGSVRKIILSKNFKGGEATSFFGGTEIILNQADINGTVVLDLTQVFGGTKLIVPPNWDIKSEVTAVFGGVDDKRMIQNAAIDPTKVLVLKGTSVFGGLEIHNF